MLPIDERTVRASFVNASRKEISDLALPADFAELDWARLDYFGWRDPKFARRAYVVVPVETSAGVEPVGVLLKQADADPRSRAQCSWCQDVRLPNDVVIFGARRTGHGGRNGNTVGILICENFQCSANVRRLPPIAYLGFDAGAARQDRILELQVRSQAFAISVRDDS
jgi:hypothetical protein